MDDAFRLDLAGYDRAYIEEVLDGFFENAGRRDRKLVEIKVSNAMAERLAFKLPGATYRGVPVTLYDIGFDEIIEVVLAPM